MKWNIRDFYILRVESVSETTSLKNSLVLHIKPWRCAKYCPRNAAPRWTRPACDRTYTQGSILRTIPTTLISMSRNWRSTNSLTIKRDESIALCSEGRVLKKLAKWWTMFTTFLCIEWWNQVKEFMSYDFFLFSLLHLMVYLSYNRKCVLLALFTYSTAPHLSDPPPLHFWQPSNLFFVSVSQVVLCVCF